MARKQTIAGYLKDKLSLQPHPEGGHFRETYRSEDCWPENAGDFPAGRSAATGIYYLLEEDDFSSWHRIKSDEMWHHYAGGTLEIHSIDDEGRHQIQLLGPALGAMRECSPQLHVPANTWFACRPGHDASFVLAGCTVAPGFHFEDFDLADADKLIEQFPHLEPLIRSLAREMAETEN